MLIERDREVEKLLELLADAVDGEGRLVFVGGEAGVGKTSLIPQSRRQRRVGWTFVGEPLTR